MAVQQGRRRVETGGVPLGYVEDFDELRTTLADVFSILPLAGNIHGRIAQQRLDSRRGHILA